MKKFVCFFCCIYFFTGCASTEHDGPTFSKNQLHVESKVKRQVQQDDFNGIFYIQPDEVMIEQEFWNRAFMKYSQNLDSFFYEFQMQMKKLAIYYDNTEAKERMMASAEKNFHLFCQTKGVGNEFIEWRRLVQSW